jgi:hypothetical protein
VKKIVYLLFIIAAASANEITTKSSSVLLLDGVNFREYSLSGLSDLKNLFYRPLTFIGDTMENHHDTMRLSKPHLTVLADLSSETGEPLFLRITGSDSRNREHGTYGKLAFNLPGIHTLITGSYSHLGMYADRIEDFCSNYEQHRKSSLPFRDMGHYGVATYAYGQIKTTLRGALSNTLINRYGEWVVLPGLYNPLYKKGTAVSQSLKIPLNNSCISFAGMADQRKIYTDHNSSIKKIYYDLQADYSRKLFIDDMLAVNIGLSNKKDNGDHFGIQFRHIADVYRLSVAAGVWNAGMPDADVKIEVPFFDSCVASLGYSLVYIPGEITIPQTIPLNVVTTGIDPLQYSQIRLSSTFRNFFRTPLSLEFWTDYKSEYQVYAIEPFGDTLSTQFTGSGDPIAAGGGTLKIVQNFRYVSLRAQCRGNLNFIGKPFEYVPYECGAGFTCFIGNTATIRTDFDLTFRGPVEWSALYAGRDSTTSSSQILFCNFGVTIPFILPILSSHLTPQIAIKGGPIALRPSGRQQYHPFGSPLGPLIAATLFGDIH